MVQIFFDRGKNIVGKGENVLKKKPPSFQGTLKPALVC